MLLHRTGRKRHPGRHVGYCNWHLKLQQWNITVECNPGDKRLVPCLTCSEALTTEGMMSVPFGAV